MSRRVLITVLPPVRRGRDFVFDLAVKNAGARWREAFAGLMAEVAREHPGRCVSVTVAYHPDACEHP